MAYVEYAWHTARSYKINPQAFGEELEAIASEHGHVTPALLLSRAQSPQHMAHNHFEWDDSKAGVKYRLSQAGELIRAVKVVAVSEKAVAEPVRAFVSVFEETRAYQPITKVLGEEDLRQQMLAQAQEDLLAWRRRYAAFVEFDALFRAIDKAFPLPGVGTTVSPE